MLSTFTTNKFGIIVSDTTVSVAAGAARIGNTLLPFNGAVTTFNSMVNFGGDAHSYQNVLLYLEQADSTASGVDMTQVASDTTTNSLAVQFPSMPDSSGFPLAMFTFFSSDGVTPSSYTYTNI